MAITPIHPPLEPLHQLVAQLQGAGITVALGGSGLLHAHGLIAQVRDWDLTTDTTPGLVAQALTGLPWEDRTSPERFATACRFVIPLDEVEIDLMSRFAIPVDGPICHLPTLIAGEWQGLPLGSLEVWAAAYWLMGRMEKAELVLAHLGRVGAEPNHLARILQEPMPAPLRERLEALR